MQASPLLSVREIMGVDSPEQLTNTNPPHKTPVDCSKRKFTGETNMKTFLCMVNEQSGKLIRIHLDYYVKGVVAEYAEYIKKALHPKKVPISPGVAFKAEDAPELPDQLKQKY